MRNRAEVTRPVRRKQHSMCSMRVGELAIQKVLSPSPKAEALQCGAQAQDINTGEYVMVYRGQIQGNVVVLKECPSVPDGTEVEVLVPGTEASTTPVQGEHSVASRTFGLIPADLTTVRAVIEEALYDDQRLSHGRHDARTGANADHHARLRPPESE